MKTRIKNLFLLPTLIAGLALISAGRVTAQTFTNLYNFTATSNSPPYGNSDGSVPLAGLILSGNTLYGTASQGGSSSYGTVFKVNADGTSFTNLHSFTSNLPGYNTDGATPLAGLILSGNTLYGTARYGSSASYGTVFAVNTDGTGFTNLHDFTGGSDGGHPFAKLILSGNTLYGTTQIGGTGNRGVVFKVNTNGTDFTNLRSLGNEGAHPQAGLILSGNILYGTTADGGSSSRGSVFAINTDGTGFTNLHSFTSTSSFYATNSDGANPVAGLFLSGDTLWGTASHGGSSGYGTLFRVKTDGTGFTNLHNFTAADSDGERPLAGLILSGNVLYGTTVYGGSSHNGAVFAMNTDGTGFTNLYSFTAAGASTNSDGAYPSADLFLSGNILYGTAAGGSSSGGGTVFSISLPVNPPPNQRPIVANPIPDTNSTYGSAFNFTFAANTFSDPDAGQNLSYLAGNLPPGITFDGPTRTFSGTPTNAGTFSVTVTATDDGSPPLSTNDLFDIVVAKASLIVTANNKSRLPNVANPPLGGTLTGVTNNDNITATFTTTAVTGSPPGNYQITPVFTDPDNRLTNYTVTTNVGTLTVLDCSTLAITNATLPDTVEGAPYSVTLLATNGIAPYTFAIMSGTLPGNLTLSTGGLLSGTATNAGSFPFSVMVTGAEGCTASSNYVLTVVCPTITVLPATLPDGTAGASYSQTITASGGPEPYTFAVTSGALPNGLSLSTSGLLSGTPTAGGNFTITATDAGGCTGSRNYSITVQLPVYEGFAAYSPGAVLNGLDGGIGFADAWGGSNSFLVVQGSLAGVVPSDKNLEAGNGTISRRLAQSVGDAGTVRYLSVFVRFNFPFGPQPVGRIGVMLNGTTGPGLFVGKPDTGSQGNWVLENASGGLQVAGPPWAGFPAGIHRLVVKCEFFAGNDRFTLYVNPVPGQPEPASGTVKFDSDVGTLTNLAFTAAGLSGFVIWGFDELHMAPSYALAVPIPPKVIVLTNEATLSNGSFQFAFTNASGATFTAFATTNPALPLNTWTELGPVTEISPGQFQFTDPQATNGKQRFYRVRWP